MTSVNEHISLIPNILSEPRFATYLQHSGNNKAKALELYQWNLELSAALIVPLHLIEIAVRNAVVETLDNVHTPNWPWNNGFIRSLPNPQKGYNPTLDLQRTASKQPTAGKVVAELKFIFWQKMFTVRHDNKLWNQHLRHVFQHAPQSMSVQQLRVCLHNDIATIRELRNRIAHHEPIFARNIKQDYEKMLTIIGWRNPAAADWMSSFERVTDIILRKPIS